MRRKIYGPDPRPFLVFISTRVQVRGSNLAWRLVAPPEITLVVGYCQEYGLELIFTVHASHIRLVGRLGSEVRVSTDFQFFSRGKLRGRISPGGYLIDSQYGVNVVILSTSSKIWGPGQHLGACAPQVPYCKTVPALKLIRCYLIKLIQY